MISSRSSPLIHGLSSQQFTAELGDGYFRAQNNFPWSPGIAAAAIETAGAGALLKCFPGITTKVNLATTLIEFVNAAVSNSKKIPKLIKEDFLAWLQVIAGISGFIGVIKENLFDSQKHDFSRVPFWEKVGLSVASAFNVFSMASGAIEKSLLSMVCKNRDEDNELRSIPEYRTSRSSAQSDRRCQYEWFGMALLPWLYNFTWLKKVADVLISYFALKEGCETFAERIDKGEVMFPFLPEKWQGEKLKGLVKFSDDPFFFLRKEDKEKNDYKLLWPYDRFIEFLIGTESDENGPGSSGFRNYCIAPMFSFFGCKDLPHYYLDNDGNIIVEFEEQDNSFGNEGPMIAGSVPATESLRYAGGVGR
ncbi:MAG: hypothetical protein A3B68_06480 [Candidatus Melainabacteria bacterium RIFCSPHIGHO2_02_FULL_34_12]|nr:MAG: hypothetical protein A3B68_06480 [Candidatus Melainabacteria bacterium RIFCSPHIGHO2_02_FULL_34_12]